jgi:tetratricopeptide (TPR) repeat protein
VNRANAIRKRAQEFLRKRDWPKAIAEYERLVQEDQSNPNVFNELGDLYLKVGDREKAIEAFEKAVRAYAKLGLYNNAVAVCKKILRFQPDRLQVIFQLGKLRLAQKLVKEAATYFHHYLDQLLLDVGRSPSVLKEELKTLSEEAKGLPEIQEKIAEALLHWDFRPEAKAVYERLYECWRDRGDREKAEAVHRKMKEANLGEPVGAISPTEPPPAPPGEPKRSVEEEAVPEPPPASGEPFDHRTIELGPSEPEPAPWAGSAGGLGASGSETVSPAGPETIELGAAGSASDSAPEAPSRPEPGSPPGGGGGVVEGGESRRSAPSPSAPEQPGREDEREGSFSNILEEFKTEIRATIDGEDYRSHYDLGMAYLEMDLLPEAIREFQQAARSSQYRVRCLEMIGLCFIRQNQPHLAIKQLQRGLALAGDDDQETLGLKYNLGLAYEMIGDAENARRYFEEVYMVDVTFRDVAQKMKATRS